ncbi:MAG: hypothetical protein J6B22_07050 [Clostridia bacterium]|nr:hypothetical protein [Clostridia bacterium]
MKAKRNIWAFFIISILGTIGHFLYELSGKIAVIGLFFPVNESTWEHLKLLFYPALIFFTAEYFLLQNKPKNYVCSSVSSIFVGMISIIILFYTYQGFVGKNIDFLNITIYYFSVIITLFTQRILIKNSKANPNKIFCLIPIIIMAVLFAVFTFNPPSLGIFAIP